MKARLVLCILVVALAFGSNARAAAVTTWFPQEFTCPVCKTKNKFFVVGSYGSYIYQWPSKFELVFWPLTDSPTVYACKQCHVATFMWDFEGLPKEKHEELRKRLAGFKLEYARPAAEYDEGADYLRIPSTQRLLAAEQTYQVLGRDDEFWCQFYRTLGHHYEEEKKQAQADEARRKALAIAERMLADKARAGERKELLYITGAMRHFLKDDPGALKDFREAAGLKYESKLMGAEKSKNYDEYLSDLLRQYFELLGAQDGKKRVA
jgi:uncharacterized protein (DUF2225 family)